MSSLLYILFIFFFFLFNRFFLLCLLFGLFFLSLLFLFFIIIFLTVLFDFRRRSILLFLHNNYQHSYSFNFPLVFIHFIVNLPSSIRLILFFLTSFLFCINASFFEFCFFLPKSIIIIFWRS